MGNKVSKKRTLGRRELKTARIDVDGEGMKIDTDDAAKKDVEEYIMEGNNSVHHAIEAILRAKLFESIPHTGELPKKYCETVAELVEEKIADVAKEIAEAAETGFPPLTALSAGKKMLDDYYAALEGDATIQAIETVLDGVREKSEANFKELVANASVLEGPVITKLAHNLGLEKKRSSVRAENPHLVDTRALAHDMVARIAEIERSVMTVAEQVDQLAGFEDYWARVEEQLSKIEPPIAYAK